MDPDKIALFQTIFPFIAIIVSVSIGGWVLNTWLRIKHGYPLDGAWGQAVYPSITRRRSSGSSCCRPRMRSCAPSWARSRTGSPMSSASSRTTAIASRRRSKPCARPGTEPWVSPKPSSPSSSSAPAIGFVPESSRGSTAIAKKARARAQIAAAQAANPGYTRQLEERLRVLERIVTDQGHGVAHEIERLRDERVARQRWKEREELNDGNSRRPDEGPDRLHCRRPADHLHLPSR